MADLRVLSGREASIFACLTDAVVAPEPPLPPVRETDAVRFFDEWLSLVPRPNRAGMRALLWAAELAPLVSGFGGRLRRLDRARRGDWLHGVERAEGGMSVAMLEEGERFTTDDFNARPRDMMARLYRDAGQIATLGNVPVILPLGRSVAGSTLINSGTCFRTPPAVLAMWGERFGLDGMAPAELDPFFRRVERIQNVVQVPPEYAGRNALVVKRGADALGWSGDFIYRNVRGCVGSGICTFGCPTSAKQHVGLTYVPLAWDAGATTYTGARARRLEMEGGRVRAVEASTAGGGRLRVECDLAVVACGSIGTPLFLRSQGVGGESGELG